MDVDNDAVPEDEIDGDPLASIGQRIGARAVDWLILMAVALIIGLVSVGGEPDTDPPVWATLTTILIVLVYESALVAWRGQTVGKMLLGIEIVSLAHGKPPQVLAAVARAVPIVALLVVLQQFAYIAMVFVYFTAGFMKHSRGVLDLLAGTVVIQGRTAR